MGGSYPGGIFPGQYTHGGVAGIEVPPMGHLIVACAASRYACVMDATNYVCETPGVVAQLESERVVVAIPSLGGRVDI